MAVPLLSFVMPLPQAAAILLPILCVMDLFAVSAYRGQYSASNLRRLLPGGLVGIAGGALAFGVLDERWLRVVVGAIAVTFALRWILGRETEKPSGSAAAAGVLRRLGSMFTTFTTLDVRMFDVVGMVSICRRFLPDFRLIIKYIINLSKLKAGGEI